MPVPSSINDLSTTAASNSPSGSETPTEGDNYIRTLSAFIASLRDKLNGTSATGTVKDATFSGTHTFSSGNLISGTYTPTGTAGTSVNSVTPNVAQYIRVGNVVTVSGSVSVNVSATTACDFGLSLPIASSIANAYEVAGVCHMDPFGQSSTRGGAVRGDTTNDRAQVVWIPTFTGAQALNYTYSYQVI